MDGMWKRFLGTLGLCPLYTWLGRSGQDAGIGCVSALPETGVCAQAEPVLSACHILGIRPGPDLGRGRTSGQAYARTGGSSS